MDSAVQYSAEDSRKKDSSLYILQYIVPIKI